MATDKNLPNIKTNIYPTNELIDAISNGDVSIEAVSVHHIGAFSLISKTRITSDVLAIFLQQLHARDDEIKRLTDLLEKWS